MAPTKYHETGYLTVGELLECIEANGLEGGDPVILASHDGDEAARTHGAELKWFVPRAAAGHLGTLLTAYEAHRHHQRIETEDGGWDLPETERALVLWSDVAEPAGLTPTMRP